jgi:hypothetical protein
MITSHVTELLQYRTDYEFIWTQLGSRTHNALPHTICDIETPAVSVMFSASVSTTSKWISNRLRVMWNLNLTVNVSLRILASRWIGISGGGCSQLVLNISSVACLQDPAYRWGHYPIEGHFDLSDIGSCIVTHIQVVVHFGDTNDSCRVTQRLKLEMSRAARTVSVLLASLVYFCTLEKIHSCAEGSVVALTQKKIRT